MRAVRFGSYSIAATLAGMSVLSRRKSMIRYRRLCPPPMKRDVWRPWLLRPPVERRPLVRDFSGGAEESYEKSSVVWNRRPAEVGLNFLTGILVSLHALEELDGLLSRGEADVGFLPGFPTAHEPTHALELSL